MRLKELVEKLSGGVKLHAALRESMMLPEASQESTHEVLLASACRRLVLGIGEKEVNLGMFRELADNMPEPYGSPGLWGDLFDTTHGLRSPPRKNQDPLIRSMIPLVPELCRYGGKLGGDSTNPWNPSNLLFQVVGAGLGPGPASESLLRRLAEALSVDGNDDILAQYLEHSLLKSRTAIGTATAATAMPIISVGVKHARGYLGPPLLKAVTPAQAFCRDLEALISLKGKLTRRQWTLMLQTLFRIALPAHVIWSSRVMHCVWDWAEKTSSSSASDTRPHSR